MKRVSVCIPTFNGGKYIKQQIDSILMQLGDNDEIIISDDTSTDNTLEIIYSYNDKRIAVFENNNFKSPVYNLENALKKASGAYIFLSDQDDIWMPEKVSVMLGYLKIHSTVVSDCKIINQDNELLCESIFKLQKSGPGFLKNFKTNSYLGCCIALQRKMLNYILPFPSGIAMHDIWIGLISEVYGNPVFIDNKLISYRRHGNNLSSASEKSQFSLAYKLKYRLVFLLSIIARSVNIMFKKKNF